MLTPELMCSFYSTLFGEGISRSDEALSIHVVSGVAAWRTIRSDIEDRHRPTGQASAMAGSGSGCTPSPSR